MATLSPSTSSLQRDIRGESRSYKRYKDHSTKWALGNRPSYGCKMSCLDPEEFSTGSPEQQAKVRPRKKWSDGYTWDSHHSGRIARKQDALSEASAGSSLSRSLTELLSNPSASTRTSSVDSGVLYSFDAPSTPRKVVGLDSLVEKAEIEWQSRETDKIVRDEYEILDERGETKVLTKGKGKKGSPKHRAQVVVEEDEDDWETI